jgi:alpha-ketoglutarate-dependent taurine dioxygenase
MRELAVAEGEALLDRLWAHATEPRFCWTQVWQAGDVMMWDNRCALHRRDESTTIMNASCTGRRSAVTSHTEAVAVAA